ncbi:Uncharacterised protein [Mycobacteroides abscessus subsp. abscessus]|nr:Uncharacterised protein [Mycobacteroides abscessus subsp. abscessus]
MQIIKQRWSMLRIVIQMRLCHMQPDAYWSISCVKGLFLQQKT